MHIERTNISHDMKSTHKHTSIDDCFSNCGVVYSHFSTVRRASNRGKTGHVNFDRLMSNGWHTVEMRKLYAIERKKKLNYMCDKPFLSFISNRSCYYECVADIWKTGERDLEDTHCALTHTVELW